MYPIKKGVSMIIKSDQTLTDEANLF